MYTYFIADDETKIRQGIRRLIDWETLGFSFIGEASNGEAVSYTHLDVYKRQGMQGILPT